MINLLNPTQKRRLKAGWRNTIWLRYTLLIMASFIAINTVFGFTALYIYGQENIYKEALSDNASLRGSDYKSKKEQAISFRSNLAIAKTILDGETNYSSIIFDIASTVPSNCILESLTLNNQSFGSPQSFSFKCKSQTDSLRLKSALQSETDLFKDVNIVSTNQTAEGADPYKTSVTMSAILLKPASSDKENS